MVSTSGSAFRAIAGFGRHGVLHEQHFYELAGDLAIEWSSSLRTLKPIGSSDSLRQEKVRLVLCAVAGGFGRDRGRGWGILARRRERQAKH